MASFLITIDTEGDDLWSAPREIGTKNAEYLPRFQNLCDTFGFKPTYLTNYEMASSRNFISFGREVQRRGVGEIGMHLHAWNSPPIVSLTSDDYRYQPYLIEYEEAVLRDKVAFMTDLLENVFETKMTSHRAGRWGFDSAYARALDDHGYLVDGSVTPHVSWRGHLGDPNGRGGTDFRDFPDQPYLLDLDDIRHEGKSHLLEVPMTIRSCPVANGIPLKMLLPFDGIKAVDRLAKPLAGVQWLRPNGHNLDAMLKILDWVLERNLSCAAFMLHSSELMPGGSPRFPTAEHIEILYQHLEILFEKVSARFRGRTMTQFYHDNVWRNDA